MVLMSDTSLAFVGAAITVALGAWVLVMASSIAKLPRPNASAYTLERHWNYILEYKTILRLDADGRHRLYSRSFHNFGVLESTSRCKRLHEPHEMWLTEQVGNDRWGYIPYHISDDLCAIWLTDPDDALAFKMRWY